MRIFQTFLLFLSVCTATFAADEAANPTAKDVVFREPFTLKLHVDKEHFYEEKFAKIPFVYHNEVYLFKDDEFGLNLDLQEDTIRAVKYQPDLKKADVTLKFAQEVRPDGTAMMLLHIANQTKLPLDLDALMTAPGRKEIAKTNILTVYPGKSGYESWPHPIVQLVLRNFRVKKEVLPSGESPKP